MLLDGTDITHGELMDMLKEKFPRTKTDIYAYYKRLLGSIPGKSLLSCKQK